MKNNNNDREFVILGLGRMGQAVCDALAQEDCNVTVIDNNKEKIEMIAPKVTRAICADITDENVLKKLDIGNCDVVLVAVASNLEASVLTCVMLKELGCKNIIAKAQGIHHKIVLEKIGVDKVVLPEAEMGTRLAINLLNSNKLKYVEYNTDYTIVELEPQPEWIGKNLIQLNLRRDQGINVIAIKKKNNYGEIDVTPKPEYIISKDDLLVAICASDKFTF